MDGRFSSAYDHSLQKSDTCREESEEYLLGDEVMTDFLDLYREYKLGIVAETAPQVASRSEDYRGELPWIVQESCFLDGGELHIMLEKF